MVLVCLSGSNWTLLKSLRRMRPGSDAIQAHWSTGLFGLGLALLSTRDSENNVNLFFCETHGEYTSTWVIYCDPWEYDGLFCNSSWIMIKLIRLKNIWRNTSRYGILSYLFMSWCVSMCLDASTVGWTAGHGTGPPSTWHLSWRDFNSVTSCTTVVLVHFMSIMSIMSHKVAGSHVCPPAIHIKSLKTKIALWRYCDAKDSKETATARHRRSDEPWWTREVSKKAEPMESRHMNVVWIVYVVFGFWISLLVSTRLSTTRWLGLVAIWTRLDNLHPWHPWHPWAHAHHALRDWAQSGMWEKSKRLQSTTRPNLGLSAWLDPAMPDMPDMPQYAAVRFQLFPWWFPWFLPFLRLFWLIFILFLLHSVAPLLVLFQTSSLLLGPYESALASIVSLTQKVQLQESALESSSTYDIVNKIYQHANTFAQRRPAGWRNFA